MTNMDVVARFEAKVQKTDGCWLWTGHHATNGYGHVNVRIGGKYRMVGTHRLAWEMHFGPIPDGMYVCHKCDVRNCVRPDHLFLGTPRDNVHDMIRKGRASFTAYLNRTHCVHGHALTPENTRIEGLSRICRRCVANRVARHRARRRAQAA